MLKFNKVGGKEIQKFPHILIPFYAKHQEMQNSMFMKTHLIHFEITLETYLLTKTTNTFTLFIFCGIYSQAINFCFFSFFWDIFVFLAISYSGLGTICSFSVKDHLSVARRAHVWVELTTNSVSPALPLGGFVLLDVLNDQRIYI